MVGVNRGSMRIKVLSENNELYIESYQSQTLLEVLLENNVFVPNICHGNGTCGKCKIRVVEGYLPITEADRRSLTENELKQGIRLACKANIRAGLQEKEVNERTKEIFVEKVCKTEQEELWIEIVGESEEGIVVESISEKEAIVGLREKNKTNEYGEERTYVKQNDNSIQKEFVQVKLRNKNHFIAIDIGTTTIAMALIDEITGEVINTYTSLNHQRKYGADVISRITAANGGKAEELKKTIEEDLWKGIKALVVREKEIEALTGAEYGIKAEANNAGNDIYMHERRINLNKIIIAGNTTMIHLLMGYSCESLGKYPFVSEYLHQIECTLKDCIRLNRNKDILRESATFESNNCTTIHYAIDFEEEYENTPVTILPGISAFVGGDIVADVVACEGFETEEICLLIDLGTNGEMVLGNKDRLLTASAAAGPAFEGGNITCGMASIPGSICQVKIQNQKAIVRTIKSEMPPNGICGTGLVSAMAQLKQNKLINEDGELKQPYHKNGFPLWIFENGEKIALYQKDIREFQMAKAAIRAGIEILMEEYGCIPTEVKSVFIAGGFGRAINIEDILTTGIMPEAFRNKISIIGNGVLQGILSLGTKAVTTKHVEMICQRAENVTLSQKESFQKKYVEYMKL